MRLFMHTSAFSSRKVCKFWHPRACACESYSPAPPKKKIKQLYHICRHGKIWLLHCNSICKDSPLPKTNYTTMTAEAFSPQTELSLTALRGHSIVDMWTRSSETSEIIAWLTWTAPSLNAAWPVVSQQAVTKGHVCRLDLRRGGQSLSSPKFGF